MIHLTPGTLTRLSKRTGYTPKMLGKYAATARRPRYPRAVHLEKTTGIPVAVWLEGTPAELKKAIADLFE